ncbi:hypothetical protein [Helicobacter canis]|uniref:Methyltransferase domain-containing protein n=1 Tax=Helicobacter canis TaxID=29419 RepID=A0A377J4D9_9HELI|nr:hypothetical protein [Helicobacter canis]STO97352.1 Uncharacterised protein [Helicobacter canis]
MIFLWGGGQITKDSACSDKSPILRRGLAHYRLDKSLRPRLENKGHRSALADVSLESGDFSSTILESQSSAESTNPAASKFKPESTFTQHKPFSSTILESQSSSESHKTRRSRSFFSKSHREQLSLESTFTQSPDSSSTILESCANSKNQKSFREQTSLESTFEKSHDSKSNAHSLSSRASETSVAIHKGAQADSKKAHNTESLESTFSKVDSRVDCHADFQSARNDRKNATFQKVDSSTATNVSEPQNKRAESAFDKRVAGGRIFDEKAGLCSLLCGDKTDGLSHKQKASSPLYRKKPTPSGSKNCGGAGVALHTFGGRSYLGGNDYPPNVCNQSHCPPKAESPKGKVVAIDSIYTTLTPTTTYPNITLEPDLFHALDRYEFDLFFASDVLHHLSPDFTQKLLESIAHIPIIIIKDIDSRHIFGHYANALHDLVFNQEKVCKIYPNKLESTLQALGYTTRYHYLPKLWYPHFLLLAYKPPHNPTTTKDINER